MVGEPANLVQARNVGEALAVTGAAAYGATYLGCIIFYGPFGVEPADIGLGYAELLGQAAVYLALLAATMVPLALLAVPSASDRAGTAIAFGIALAITVIVALIGSAILGSSRVKDGKAPGGQLGLDVLPWNDAQVAAVRWIGSGTPPPLPRCVVRLGESAGTEVLYDPATETTLRLPQSSVVVTIKPEEDPC